MLATYFFALASVTVTIGQTSDLTYVQTLTSELQYPGRLAPAGGGGIYVTDQPNGQVVEFDAAGAVVGTYLIPEGPVGIAVHQSGAVYISRADGVVGVYDASLNYTSVDLIPTLPLAMDQPNDIAVNPATGDIFVVDAGSNRVWVFDAGNAYLGTWGITGNAGGEFNTPQSIAIDAALGHVVVTDADNFRVQVFDTSGVLQYRFGYRTLFLPGSETAWFARVEGVAIDSCSNIYLTDALMGTVRVFDSVGVELDLDPDEEINHVPAIEYGTDPGELRVPCDIAIDGGKLFVASTYNSAVEVYNLSCGPAPAPLAGTAALARDAAGDDAPDRTARKQSASRARFPDNPFTIAQAIETQTYDAALDVNGDRRVDVEDLELAVAHFGAGTVDDFLGHSALRDSYPAAYLPPHLIDIPNQCGRCHSMDGLPGGILTAEGQENLCLSCHTASGVALGKPISGVDKGNSHPRGIPADSGDVRGPDPDSYTEIALHLDGGNIRCGTCHEPMTSEDGAPYLRASIGDGDLCSECHIEGAQWELAGHSDGDSRAFGYPTGPGRESCAKCHSGLGYIDFAAGVPENDRRTDKQVHSCFVCHGVHENDNEDLLRVFGDVTLPGDTVVDAGHNASCMVCHNGRYVAGPSHLTPHYALGGVMLEGINGLDFGATIPNSPHTVLAGCADCHMAATPGEGAPGAGKVGEHTFAMTVHDPEDDDYGFENFENSCNTADCHGYVGPLRAPDLLVDGYNRTAQGDYDGDGDVEGVQDEVQGLLDAVRDAIIASGAAYDNGRWYTGICSGGGAGSDDGDACYSNRNCDGDCTVTADQVTLDAIWNHAYVVNDGSMGIHNTSYAVGLLQVTYKALTGVDVPDAFLRYDAGTFALSDTHVEVQLVNDGNPVEPGAVLTVQLTVEDDAGDPIDQADLNRLRIFVSGPSYNYQRVTVADSSNFTQNPDGSYTYVLDPFPTVYMAPVNDSPYYDRTDGEMTGDALDDGTYTVAVESRRSFGSIRKAGDATFDFVVAEVPASAPALDPRQLVLQENCNNCHLDLQLHGGGRFSVTGCVLCHTAGAEDRPFGPRCVGGLDDDDGCDENADCDLAIDDDELGTCSPTPDPTPGVTIQFGNMIHMLHTGHGLRGVEATEDSADPYRYEIVGYGETVHDFSEIGFPIIPSGVTDCTACHGGAADEAQIYAQPTRMGCKGCHDDINFDTGTILKQDVPDEMCIGGYSDGDACFVDTECDLVILDDELGDCGPDPAKRYAGLGTLEADDLDNPLYREFPLDGVANHTFSDEALCATCHAATVEGIHQHPTHPDQEGVGLAVEIMAVGGMTGGGGTYFVPGDYPEVTFKLSTSSIDPLQLVEGDKAVMDRIEVIFSGPTSLYQLIIPSQQPWRNGGLNVDPGNLTDNFGVDGTYTFISEDPIPADYPAQLSSIGKAPADQIFPYEGGWGQQYTAAGTPLDSGTYTVFVYGRRVAPISGEREPALSDTFNVRLGANDPLVDYSGTVERDKCNACHGNLAFHGNAREGVHTCLACHAAGAQSTDTTNSVGFRRMLHKIHNAQNLLNQPYELHGHGGMVDFSHMLISAMPGEAAECAVCHANDDWKNPPVRDNMRTWMVVCTSCHDSAETADHVEAATVSGTFIESCASCHGPGAAWSVENAHASP